MRKTSLHINGMDYDATRIMEELMEGGPAWKIHGLEFLIQLMDASDAPVKFTTSGTTGEPKEIKFSKEQIWQSATNTCNFFGINEKSSLLLCLPSYFVAGRMMIARSLYANAKLVWVEPSLNPLKSTSSIDFAAFTPAQVATIISEQSTRNTFESISKVIIGGGEINTQLEDSLQSMKNQVYATYGMTETLTHVAVRKMGEKVYHSVYPSVRFGVDERNCLTILLPVIQPEKIITKDVVELVDDQSFIWKGRLDNVINSGGVKIYAEELERKLVDEALLGENTFYVTSRQDIVFGEVPVIVLLKTPIVGDMATLLQTFNQVLNKYQSLKDLIFLDKFERTETGKIKRQKF